MNKSKTTMSKETERTLGKMDDSDLRCLLDEVCSYKHTGDMQGKSPFAQILLKQAEESESGEESIKRPPKRHKKPKERRRRKESDSLAARTHAGGSLDNIGGEKKAQTAARQRGVAGRTREGGSCCNLSRGSFETTVARRRRRRDPHRQHHGSLEDLSAIDETAAGAGRAKSSVSESGKHGGSLQNINQEGGGDFRPAAVSPAAAAAAVAATAAAAAVAVSAAAAAAAAAPPPAVIDIDDEGAPAAAADSGRTGEREQTRADATVEFSLLDPRQSRPTPYTPPSDRLDLESVGRNLGQLLAARPAGVTREELRDMPPGEPVQLASQRRTQVSADSGGGGGPSPSPANGPRPHPNTATGTARIRKAKKKVWKEEQELRTENVDGYRGGADLETILGFIESGDRKDKSATKKADKSRDGRRETKGRRNGLRPGEEERPARGAGGRGAERRPSGRGGGKAAGGRSSSLEARPGPAGGGVAAAAAAAGRADGTSVFCGDLAKSSLKKSDSTPAAAAGPTVVAFDGGTYVSPPAAERDSEGFVQDFYSVTTDSTAIEETEFHLVTRKTRRRGGGGRASAGDTPRPHALRHKTGSLDESARARHDSLGQPRRPYVPGLRRATSASAPHSELSDSDSDGAGSLPPPPPPPPPPLADRPRRASPPASAPAATNVPSSSSSGGSSWADVTRNRQEIQAATPTPTPPGARARQPAAGTRDAETSTDFIDGVGPIFGERSSPRGRPVAAVAGFVRGASEPADGLLGVSYPEEFPEIASPPAAAAAAKSPRAGAGATGGGGPSSGGAAAGSVASQATPGTGASAKVAAASNAAAQGNTRQPAAPAATQTAAAPAPAPAVSPAPVATTPDTNSAVSGRPSTPTAPSARAPSDAPSAGEPRPAAAPAPAAAAAPRRTKKAPAVTIRGTLEDALSPGAASAHVQGIQFGYIEEPCGGSGLPGGGAGLPCGGPKPAPEAGRSRVEAFCRRFRPPPVDVSRFNWAEVSVWLNKVFGEAARDPAAFFLPPDTPNGLLPPLPTAQTPP